jgi:ABC-type uncharacterized transport system substrate-binding protein
MTTPLDRLLFLALALPSLAFGAEPQPRVVVLKSADRAAYTSVVAGFSAEVKGEVSQLTLEENSAEASARTLERLSAEKPAMVLAIGPTAAVGAKRALPGVPIVFCMVPYYEKYGLEGPNVTGIAMTGDLSTELAALKAVFPTGRRVGLVYDPRYSAALAEDAKNRAKGQGQVVVPLEVDSDLGVGRALSSARGKVDAVLMVGDKTVATAPTVKRIIAFASEEKVPFLAFSPSQVKEGAVLSLSPNLTGIGQQAGRLANRIIHEKVDPGALAVSPPEGLDLATNLTVARKLGGSGELAQRILELAARQNYSLKVFE